MNKVNSNSLNRNLSFIGHKRIKLKDMSMISTYAASSLINPAYPAATPPDYQPDLRRGPDVVDVYQAQVESDQVQSGAAGQCLPQPVNFVSNSDRGSIKVIDVTENGLSEPIPEPPRDGDVTYLVGNFSVDKVDLDGDTRHPLLDPHRRDIPHGTLIALQLHGQYSGTNIVGFDVIGCDGQGRATIDNNRIADAYNAIAAKARNGDSVNMSLATDENLLDYDEYIEQIEEGRRTGVYLNARLAEIGAIHDAMHNMHQQAGTRRTERIEERLIHTVSGGNGGIYNRSLLAPDELDINSENPERNEVISVGATFPNGQKIHSSAIAGVDEWGIGAYPVTGIDTNGDGTSEGVDITGNGHIDILNSNLSKGLEPGEHHFYSGTSFAAPDVNGRLMNQK